MVQSAVRRKSFTFLVAPLISAALIISAGILAIWNSSQDIWILGYRLSAIVPIRSGTAIVLILAALVLILRAVSPIPPFSRASVQAMTSLFAVCVALIGVASLLHFFFDIDLGVEALLAKFGVEGKLWLNELPFAALGFVMAGCSLLLLDYRMSNGHYPAEYVTFILIGMMGVPLVGQLYDVMSVSDADIARAMEPFMSEAFIVLGLGILSARPSHRLMCLWNSKSPGGPLLRRLLPNSLLMLVILDLVIKWGVNNKLYGSESATPLLIVLSACLLFIMFCRMASLLNRESDGRQIGELELAKSNALLRAVSDNTPDAIFVKDLNGRIIFANPAKVRLFGKELDQVLGFRSEELYLDMKDAMRVRVEDQAVMFSGKPMIFETTTRYLEGVRTMYSAKAPWIDEQGQVMGLVGISSDITERKRMEDALKAHETQLEALVSARTSEVTELIGHIESTREEEKRAIARELHDDLGAALTALNMHLSLLFKQMPPETKLIDRSIKIKELLTSITDATRRIQNGLRPDMLDVFGVKIAIAEQAAEFEKYSGVVCKVSFPDDQLAYAPRVDIALFRIVQEALNNIAKHAQATHVDVVLDDLDDEIILTVRDNGIGISADRYGDVSTHGLRGMRERITYLGGSVRMSDVEGAGTMIVAKIPKIPENTKAENEYGESEGELVVRT